MKAGVSFDDLIGYDVKYHLQCFNACMRDSKSGQTSAMQQQCFEGLLVTLLNEGRALSMANFLNQFKSITKDNYYELFESYLSVSIIPKKFVLVRYKKKTYERTCLQFVQDQIIAKTNFLNQQQIFQSQTSKMLKVLQFNPLIHALFPLPLYRKRFPVH